MTSSPTAVTNPTDREVVLTRVFDALRELVFQAWADPAQIVQWWGPKGFSTTTSKMEVRPGGVWRFVMHGPDGQDYQNKVTYLEVVKPERLVYKHGGGDKDLEPVNFEVTVTFEDVQGKTRVTSRMIFPSAAALRHVVENYGAIEGGKQHMERLGEYLSRLTDRSAGAAEREFVISRVFDAPRDVVYKAWTERDRLMQWFGPKGTMMPRATLDLRPGGTFLYCMKMPDGNEMWGKWTFREIVPPERLVVVISFSDEHGGITRHPMAPDWPRETLSTMTFVPHAGKGGGAVVTVRWSALNPTAAERKAFDNGHDGMTQGWSGTFEQLAAYLAKG